MVNNEMVKKVDELCSLMNMEKELKAEIESLQKEIKAEIGESEEVFFFGDHQVSWKSVVSKVFDSKKFEADNPNLYAMYASERVSRRFLAK